MRPDPWIKGPPTFFVQRTLMTMGEPHGYGIARRIEQTSLGKLSINYGTLHPALLKLQQEGPISSEWGVSVLASISAIELPAELSAVRVCPFFTPKLNLRP